MNISPETRQYRERIDSDLELAERIHRSMIPRNERRGNLDVACRFTPMIGVGGDYASVFFQNNHLVLVCVSDVSGHGIAAALLASRVNSFVLSQAPSIHHPCQLGERLNSFFHEFFGATHLLLSFFCLYLDLKDQSLTYAGFGHPPVFLHSKQIDAIEQLKSENTLIGISKDLVRSCSMNTLPFTPGDRLVLYTDGISESENIRGEPLDIEDLQATVYKHAHLPVKGHLDAIARSIEKFRDGGGPLDDQLLLAVSFVDE